MWGSKLARAAVVCYLGLSGSALAQGVLPPIIPGGTGTVTSVTLNAGANITLSGSCTGTLTINCTIATSSGAGITAGSGLTLTGSVMSLGDSNLTYATGYITLGASSALAGIRFNTFNPNITANPNDNTAVDMNCSVQSYSNVNLNPLFTDSNCAQIAINTINVDSVYSQGNSLGQTLGKNTSLAMNEVGYYLGAGQKILHGYRATCFGMSDCAISSSFVTFAGGPIAGDEGQGFTQVNQLLQQQFLSLSTITSIPTQSSCNTTLTQAVTAAAAPQTVTVASTTGCSVNDWIVVGQQLPFTTSNEEAVQISAVGSPAGTIQGIFRHNFNNVSNTITPAKVLVLNSTFQTGQDRVMVDISQTPVTAGTVSSITNNAFTGAGTSWSVGMVGGNATNIGCIDLASDDNNQSPFNGTGANGTLHSYYQILSVSSTTALTIHSDSVAGDTTYHSVANSPGSGGYHIYPCARLLYLGNANGSVSGLAVLESSSSTWTVGDTIETAINPYPDVSAYQYHLAGYTPGGNWRSFLDIENDGPVPYLTGIIIASQGSRATLPYGPAAWTTALQINQATTGMQIGPNIYGAAIQLTDGTFGSGGCPADTCGNIDWGAGSGAWFIGPNSTNQALQINWAGAARSLMTVIDTNSGLITGNHDLLKWPGGIQNPADASTNYQACGTAMRDTIAVMTSGTAVQGATVTAGSLHVVALCNELNNWAVVGGHP